jgi:carbon starvation protein
MVAIVSLATVMMLARTAPLLQNPKPNFIYAQGMGSFLEVIGIPVALGVSFGLLAFATFVYGTLDVCTRLGRYIIQELTGWHDARGKWLGTVLTAGVPLLFVTQSVVDAAGNPVPVWRVFWALFGASNQLLAALTLLGVTVWLWRTQRARWVWLVTGLPTVWMYVMSVWALLTMIARDFSNGFTLNPVPWVGIVLVGLAVLMLVEAARIFLTPPPTAPGKLEPAVAT